MLRTNCTNEEYELYNICNEIICLHEDMNGAYFYKSPGNAYARRKYEKEHSLEKEFKYKNKNYNVKLETSCSCSHIYYSANIYVDDERKDIRAIKKIVKDLNKKYE